MASLLQQVGDAAVAWDRDVEQLVGVAVAAQDRGTAPAVFDAAGDFLRFEPGPGAQFNIAPVPGGADWTFYLDATPDQYTAMFGAKPQRRTFALPHHVSPAARMHVNTQATRLVPAEQAATVHLSATRAAVPMMDIDPPTRMVWTVGGGHAVLLGDALAPVRPHTACGANNGIEQAAGLVTALMWNGAVKCEYGIAVVCPVSGRG